MQKKLHKSVKRGTKYLIKSIQSSGKFIYLRDGDGNKIHGEYNLLRHLGCVWVLAKLYGDKNMDLNPKILKAFKWASKFLEVEKPHYQVINNPRSLGLVYKNSIKLGGHALYILAKTEIEKILGKTLYPNTGWFLSSTEILFFGKTLSTYGEHRSKITWDTREVSTFQSEYYLGEYALALLNLPFIKYQGNRLIDYIQKIRTEDILPDHWLAQALLLSGNKKELALRIKERILLNTGEYRKPQRKTNHITRSACRLEALTHLYPILKTKDILDECQIIADILLKAQHKTLGGFLESNVMQIDTTQHAINGLNEYLKILKDG